MHHDKGHLLHLTPEIAAQRRELAPDIHEAFTSFSERVFAAVALPVKIKQLMAVAAGLGGTIAARRHGGFRPILGLPYGVHRLQGALYGKTATGHAASQPR